MNGSGENSYSLSAQERGQSQRYKGHLMRIYGQLCVIYAVGDDRQSIWQVFGEYAEGQQAIDNQEWAK